MDGHHATSGYTVVRRADPRRKPTHVLLHFRTRQGHTHGGEHGLVLVFRQLAVDQLGDGHIPQVRLGIGLRIDASFTRRFQFGAAGFGAVEPRTERNSAQGGGGV